MTIKAQIGPSARERVLAMVQGVVSDRVQVTAREDVMLGRVDVWLIMPRWWWRARRRRELVAACMAVADVPAGLVVRVHLA